MAKNEKKVFFFYGETKIEVDSESLLGSELKQAIIAAGAAFDPAHDLVLEGHGNDEDRVIPDDERVELLHGHGGGPKHFFSRPPTNFG